LNSQPFRDLLSIARDSCANREKIPLEPDARIRLVSPLIAEGDFNGDGKIDSEDFFLFALAFGQPAEGGRPLDPPYEKIPLSIFDLDKKGRVDLEDFFTFALSFNKEAKKPAAKPVLASGPGVNQEAAVSLTPIPCDVPGRMEMSVRLKGANEVQGYSLKLTYNASALKLMEAVGSPGSVFADEIRKGLHTEGEADGQTELRPVAIQVSRDPGATVLADVLATDKVLVGDVELVQLTFQVLDEKVPAQVKIEEVSVCDREGRINVLLARTEEGKDLPTEYALSQNAPNPFNASTQIPYQLPKAGEVSLVIYNILGQQVRVLVREKQEAGYYRAAWDGKDARGRQVASGIYLVRMQASEFTQVRKILLLK
jgi:hypothetical protein